MTVFFMLELLLWEWERCSVSALPVFVDTSPPPAPCLQHSRGDGVPSRIFIREA
jgi:hypothetical protein